MKRFQTEKLIDSLKTDVEILLQCADFFKRHKESLLIQPAPEKWSVAQVLEHLNRYGHHYLSAINKGVSVSTPAKNSWYTAGWLGDFFINSIRPKSLFEIKTGMKAPKGYVPDSTLNAEAVLNEFIEQQKVLLQLLELSKQRDLNAIRIPVSVTRWIKLNLGDTLRFFIAHEQRHMIQARNALHASGVATGRFPVILQGVSQ